MHSALERKKIMRKYAVIFPGQGAQYIGMGKTLCQQYSIAENIFNEANDILHMDIKRMCFSGKVSELNRIENVLPAIFIVSIAAYRAFEQIHPIKPFVAAGHSLGEYTALTASGVLSFEDALNIVRRRSELAAQIRDGAMSIIDNYDVSDVYLLCDELASSGKYVVVACKNTEDQCVICGDQSAVLAIEDILSEKKAQITPMLSSPPFHCSLMKSVSETLKEELMKIKMHEFAFPVYSNVLSTAYLNAGYIPELLSRQVIEPVLWWETIENIIDHGVSTFIEIGPQMILSDLIRRTHDASSLLSFSQKNDDPQIRTFFAGDIRSLHRNYEITLVTKCIAAAVSTKNKNWNNDEYHKGVVEPYKTVRNMQVDLQQKRLHPTQDQCIQAVKMLQSVLQTKMTPENECEKIWDYVFEGEDLSLRKQMQAV